MKHQSNLHISTPSHLIEVLLHIQELQLEAGQELCQKVKLLMLKQCFSFSCFQYLPYFYYHLQQKKTCTCLCLYLLWNLRSKIKTCNSNSRYGLNIKYADKFNMFIQQVFSIGSEMIFAAYPKTISKQNIKKIKLVKILTILSFYLTLLKC